ncbi:Sacsin [Heracleum sosnowskyi]|uniref:Sacsin n=1 Tax=Heracleum sosnowskyi TaxID=360622 RepID=A0AAD8MPN6_9APIA|nr:Sacsin [Heracleum sosnowskyi]
MDSLFPDPSDPLLLEDFGQKVDLTRRIREVLLNYPEGTTVLKELIQNADDAGATKVCLCLDRRVHGVDSLLSKKLQQWQGPALLAFNNAVFTDDDFASISRIGGSGKQGHAWKTGRFGVGFNSVYHLTDLPSFVSGKYMVMFDPQGDYLPNVSTANPGKRIEFVSTSAISLYKDQFSPYCVFGCDMKNSFPGTLFRFPLRNAEQAANSKLSKQAYMEDDITSLFDQLDDEGVFTLLFLKNVLDIEMYVWDNGVAEPKKMYSCSVKSANDDTVWHRQALLRLSKSANSSVGEIDAFSLDFSREAIHGNQSVKRIDTFYIVQKMAAASSRIGSFAATALKDYDIHLLPWASVAACVSRKSSDEDDINTGRAFCFLPLPVKTGLTVQVNGYFEVSSNRRGIWYGADMDRSGRIRSLWNRLLLEDVVAPTFAQVLLGVQAVLGPTYLYYSLWPTGAFEEPWNILVEHIYRTISDLPVMYSELGGGRWVSPMDAFLHDEKFAKSEELREALLQLGLPIVHLPSELYDMLLKCKLSFELKVVTPESVRQLVRDHHTVITLSRSYKLILLEYCLEDLIDIDVGKNATDVPLLPLASGHFGTFSEVLKGTPYFVCDDLEYMLLQKMGDVVIDRNIPHNLYSRLTAIAEASTTNLLVFNINYLLQLFPKFVPSDWKFKTKVLWNPKTESDHPTSKWFNLFWQYLRRQSENLSLFGDWPILPSLSGHLYRPCIQSKLLNVEKLAETMQCILVKLGCKILNKNYGVEHPDLIHYINHADGAGVLKSISDVASLNNGDGRAVFHHLEVEERNELRQFLLDSTWYIGNHMADSDILICKKLPIYRVYGGETGENVNYSDLDSPRKYLPPLDCPECLLSSEFISNLSDVEEEVLIRYYGVERMRKAFFYKHHVLNRIKELQLEVRNSTMLLVLQELPQLCAEDPLFRESLRNLEFVQTSNGSLKCPAVLYDPRNEELYDLLEDSGSFPSGVFEDSSILDVLQGLGLRTIVSPETIIQSARQVERIMHDDQLRAQARGKVLLSYLEVNASKWLPDLQKADQGVVNRMFSRAANSLRSRHLKSDLEKFWDNLCMICWCPVLLSSPYEALPWPVVSSMVAPPKLVRLYKDLWLVSGTMRILDGECSSTALSYQLGWSSPPGGSAIAAQLLELGKNNEIVTDSVLRRELALAMPRIYSILMSMIGTDEMDIVKAVLEGCRWVWVGDGFATLDEVVLNGPIHLAPYIRVIPVDLEAFRDLFLELGIREFLKPNDYGNILCRMATRKGSVPLNPQEIRAALLVAQHLAEVQYFEEQIKIFLPDQSCRLVDATDLVYNDAPWLLGSEDNLFGNASTVALNAKRTVQKFVHGNISNDVAEKLGVRSLRRMLLAESADSMNMSLSGSAEAFGQHEALTTRLKHILEMYADGPGVLFELVQNAEDAGASEVTFLLDKTQYGTSSVLSPEMADWQGPALYCFNDSVFSPQDLYAISRIGQESKLEKPLAIGRFGLGFNCVYHFTDIPMFVSGENIVMFDPHACNLPGISPSHPGLRIKYVGRRILEQFPDQFSPFLHFGCDLNSAFPGTLFRFPLRSANVSSRSQIKKEGYSPEDVMSLFSSFSEVVSETLLYLRNVQTISIFVKEGADGDMQLMHRVHKRYISDPNSETSTFHKIFNSMHGSQQGELDRNQFLNKLSKSTDKELPWKCQKVLVTEQSSFCDKSHLWLTSECLGYGRIKNKPINFDDKAYKFVPWACVASLLHSVAIDRDSSNVSNPESSVPTDILQLPVASNQARDNFEGRAFCFLPLPISTGLPVHVNAYFELSSNRRDIWFGNDMAGGGKKRSDWNIHLLEDVAAPAYGHLLEKVSLEIGPCDLFFSFWPTTQRQKPWDSMVQNLYKFISESGLRVLYTKARGGQWVSTKQGIFPDFTFGKANELIEALSGAGLPVITVPKSIVDKFLEVCPSLHYLTPELLRTLLIRRKRGFKDRNAMILTLEYCLLDLKFPVRSDNLCGLPLIPLANGLFTTFEKRGATERIYVLRGEEYGLLKDSVPQQLVDNGVPESVYRKLCDIAQSEESNVSYLSSELLEKLFLRILPAEWLHAKQVIWLPGHQGQPTLDWMRLLWDYLKSSSANLAMFSNWPILPVGNNCLLQLVENSHVIVDDGWSENMSSLFQKVGCLLLSRDLPVEHAQLNIYVQPPTANGLLKAFMAVAGIPENITGLFSNVSEGELHELRSFILQSKWFSEDSLDNTHIDIIKQIPMFGSFKSRKLVCLCEPTKWLKPDGVREDLLDDDFVRIESEKEKFILRKYLQIKEPSRVEFYKTYVLNRMPEFVLQEGILSTILHDIRLLIEDDNSVKVALSSTPFVLARNGLWQEPSRLYDPRVPELQYVLHREAFFPSDKFSSPEILETLIILGLRQTLHLSGLLDCAKSVSMLHDSEASDSVIFGRRLLGCLDKLILKLCPDRDGTSCNSEETSEFKDNSISYREAKDEYLDNSGNSSEDDFNLSSFIGNLVDDKPGDEFWSELKSINWCPVYVDPPLRGLPWLVSGQEISAPLNVRPKSQMWLVSSKMHILDVECSVHLQSKLGWMDQLSVDILSTQLIELSRSYTQLKLHSEVEPEFDASLQKHTLSLYAKLQEYVNTDDFMALNSVLDGVDWIWIGDDFISPKALAFDSPVKYSPYLYVVPSELYEFRTLLSALGVRPSFDVFDYFHVLQRLQQDVKGLPLSADQLNFVHCVLEAIADCYTDRLISESSNNTLLVPDSSAVLFPARDLVFNDAPWMENNTLSGKRFVHPSISHELASTLGIQSVRSISLVSEEMTKDMPCMDFSKIHELLGLYRSSDFLLFDLLELADCCKAKKLHIFIDKREHPCQSLLQHNLGEFQGPALVAILEGASLSREEIASLQFRPPWNLRGDTLNYGLGLLSCYSISDLPSVVSNGYFYMFDPRGLALTVPVGRGPAAKMFSLMGTNLVERFRDQFDPMLIGSNMPWASSESTIIRMPLSSEWMKDGHECGLKGLAMMYDKFMEHASRTLLFLKSVTQVSLSTWELGNPGPRQDYSIHVDLSYAGARNPFSEKKWKKFQLSSIFGTSNAAIKWHIIDVNLYRGETRIADRWLIVLTLGSGQTRNMALDRRYLAYNLTPVAGVAAHVSRNGGPSEAYVSSSIMSPLPLSDSISIPVTVLGCFLVRHNQGRYLFKYQDSKALTEAEPDAGNQMIEAWNRELMSCVRDSYIKLVVEMHKLRKEPLTSSLEASLSRRLSAALNAYGDQIYTFWPRSHGHPMLHQSDGSTNLVQAKDLRADWVCLVEQVIRPFYSRLVDLPVWKLYSGNLVKAEEGMFLSQPGNGVGGSLLPATVCAFVKEHYPVFQVPWELVTEIQAVGVKVQEIKPKMVRDLLRVSSTSIVLQSVDTYVDVLEYCLSDIQLPKSSEISEPNSSADNMVNGESDEDGSSFSSVSGPPFQRLGQSTHTPSNSGGDAIELVTTLGKALFDFGRGVVEDIGRAGGPLSQRSNIAGSGNVIGQHWERSFLPVAAELKGLPCPTATNHLTKLGYAEVWVGSAEQQELMTSLAAKFIHPKLLERPILAVIFSNSVLQTLLKLQNFSLHLLANHMRSVFDETWVNHVAVSSMAPWFSWKNTSTLSSEGGPSPEWIRLFWRCFNGSMEDLPLFSDWPLIPAFLGRPVLCRVRERNLVFIPAPFSESNSGNYVSNMDTDTTRSDLGLVASESGLIEPYIRAYEFCKNKYPWLFSLLNKCSIPVVDASFMDCVASSKCIPTTAQSLGQLIASKLVAAKHAGYLPELTSFLDTECDELFTLLASDFSPSSSEYQREELDVLRDLPIYKTAAGTYTRLAGQDICMISSNTFLKPSNERCLSYTIESVSSSLLRALGVPEMQDQQILVRFGLPGFEEKPQAEREDILIYLYTKWYDLQHDSSIVEALKETNFVRSADELSATFCKPKDLFDPADTLLASVFSGDRKKFPGERFVADGWINILRKTGLRTASEADVVLECAKKVESLGNETADSIEFLDDFEADLFSSKKEVSIETWSLAETLVKAIFANFAVLYSNNFCSCLGKIACIPAEKGFPNVGGKNGRKRVLSSYSEAILLKDWPLAWSSAPILSKQSVVPPEYSWGALQLRSPPSFSTVVKHLKVIGRNFGEDTLAHWPTASSLMTVDKASFEVLKYLEKIWDSLSSSDIAELQNVAFMPAANGTRLVAASSLFARLTINLSPFAFELPASYLPFLKFLKILGLQDILSVSCAKDLLLNLQKSCGYQRLNPNELRAVMEVLHFVTDKSTEAHTSQTSNWGSEAIVPDDGCRLVHASSCLYIDSFGSRYIKYIDTSTLKFVHQDIPERINTFLGIRKLSDVVVEELDHREDLQTLESIGSVTLTAIKQKLISKPFQAAVGVVVNSLASDLSSFDNPTPENIQLVLQSVSEQLQFVRRLYTRFLFLPRSRDITRVNNGSTIPGWEDESKHRALYFVDKSRTRMLIAQPPTYMSVSDLVAVVVSHVLGSPFPLPIGSLFLCPEDSETAIVSILKLPSDERVVEHTRGRNSLLGSDILSQDAVQVQFHPMRPFYTGEIVAWRSQNGEKLKYGRVPEDVRPSAGQALYRLNVETSLGVTEPLLSSHVFSFKSVSAGGEASSANMLESVHDLVENRLDIRQQESSERAQTRPSQGEAVIDLQRGQVSAAELVQAVHEMLSAAGISMDVEKQSLLQTTLTLQEQLRESQAALLLEQERSDMAAKEADSAKAAWQCRVCLTNEVDITIIPCGHVLCRRCSSAVTKCPFCRLQVSKTVKIYRP